MSEDINTRVSKINAVTDALKALRDAADPRYDLQRAAPNANGDVIYTLRFARSLVPSNVVDALRAAHPRSVDDTHILGTVSVNAKVAQAMKTGDFDEGDVVRMIHERAAIDLVNAAGDTPLSLV